MREVSKISFFAAIKPLDCVSHLLPGRYPYTTVFRMRHSPVEIGRISPAGHMNPFPTYKYELKT